MNKKTNTPSPITAIKALHTIKLGYWKHRVFINGLFENLGYMPEETNWNDITDYLTPGQVEYLKGLIGDFLERKDI